MAGGGRLLAAALGHHPLLLLAADAGLSRAGPDLPAVIPFLAVIFVSAAMPTPGMAGSLDLASKYALTGLFGVTAETAVAFTILFHFLLLVAPIALGLARLLARGLELQNHRPAGEKR